jgi:DnaJ-class molecular chaperone
MSNIDRAYEILEISPPATPEQIKKKYYQLALKYHPDKNSDPDSAAKFAELSNAYELISGEAGKIRNGGGEDIIKEIIINFFTKFQQQRSSFITCEVVITLEELFNGTTKDIVISNNIYTVNIPKGTNIDIPCIIDNIIPGVTLMLQISVAKHNMYTINYPDISTAIDISLCESLIGFERTIKLLDSREKVIKSDSVIAPNTTKTIKGLGITENGSLNIFITVRFPKSISDDEKNIIKLLASSHESSFC